MNTTWHVLVSDLRSKVPRKIVRLSATHCIWLLVRASEEAALHAVFLQQVEEMLITDVNDQLYKQKMNEILHGAY